MLVALDAFFLEEHIWTVAEEKKNVSVNKENFFIFMC